MKLKLIPKPLPFISANSAGCATAEALQSDTASVTIGSAAAPGAGRIPQASRDPRMPAGTPRPSPPTDPRRP